MHQTGYLAKVRFKLRQYKDKDPWIQFIYRLDGAKNELVFGVGIHIPEKHWKKETRRARKVKSHPENEMTNKILDKWESTFNNLQRLK